MNSVTKFSTIISLLLIGTLVHANADFGTHGYVFSPEKVEKKEKKNTGAKTKSASAGVQQMVTPTVRMDESRTERNPLSVGKPTNSAGSSEGGGSVTIQKLPDGVDKTKEITYTGDKLKQDNDMGPDADVRRNPNDGTYTVTIDGRAYKATKVDAKTLNTATGQAKLLNQGVSMSEQNGGRSLKSVEGYQIIGQAPKLRDLLTSGSKPHEPSYYNFITGTTQQQAREAWKPNADGTRGGTWTSSGPEIPIVLIDKGKLVGGGGGGGGGMGMENDQPS